MNLGTVIRAARRAKDLTQEELAGILGVTISAVSQWEQGKTMPDISLVPAICSALDLTADALFGIDLRNKEDRIEEVIAQIERMEDRNESPRDALALLEEALALYPDSMRLTEQTAYVLSVLSHSGEESPEARQVYDDRCAALNEKILARSTDESARQGAKQSLIFHALGKKDFARALELAKTMPTCYVSREELLFTIAVSMHDLAGFQYYKQFFLARALEKIAYCCVGEDGSPCYSDDEMATIYKKKLAVMEILYDGDTLLSSGAVSYAHSRLAEYEAGRGDMRSALAHLREAAKYAEALRDYLAPVVIDRHTVMNGDELPTFTCLLFRGGRDDTVGGGGMQDARALLALMEKPVFDPLRGDADFIAARERVLALTGEG